ncbi:MAG TPA: hypothetical protein PK303_07440 [bacterium]|nr:hypothetical protein [bacterium]HOL35443.1 hypothetical protein [bacterium]HPP08935.1 hypothetical protein [bacterium]
MLHFWEFLFIDSLGSYFKLWSFSNYPRLFLGLLGGSSISLFLFPVFNWSLFAESEEETGIKQLIEYLGLLLLLELVVYFVLIGNLIAHQIIAFTSILGILLLYLMINITISARITCWEDRKSMNGIKAILLIGIILILGVIEFYLLKKTHLKL